jgi:hypothetical protein
VAPVVPTRRADDELRRIEYSAVLAADRVLDRDAVAHQIALVDHFDAEQQLPADVVLRFGCDARALGSDDAGDVRVGRRIPLELLDGADITIGCRQTGADELEPRIADHRDRLDDRRLVPVQMQDLHAVGEYGADWHGRRPAVRDGVGERLVVE